MKQCSICKQLKPESEFSNNKKAADGLDHRCKDCKKQYNKKWYSANREQINGRRKQRRVESHEQVLEYEKQWRFTNREKINERSKRWKTENQEKNLLGSARRRAKKRGLEFNLELSDIKIPEYCPILGLKLARGEGKCQDNSPSLDRIDSSKGYVKGNVMVMSVRANMIKNCGTAEEHRLIAEFLERNAA